MRPRLWIALTLFLTCAAMGLLWQVGRQADEARAREYEINEVYVANEHVSTGLFINEGMRLWAEGENEKMRKELERMRSHGTRKPFR